METERERNIRKIYERLGVEPWQPEKPVVVIEKKKKRAARVGRSRPQSSAGKGRNPAEGK